MKLSLALIFKDEVDQFKRIVNLYQKYFDEIVVAVDDKVDEFIDVSKANQQIKVIPYLWVNDFAAKRNFVHSHITGDYYVRIDADDEIVNPDRLRVVAENALKEGTSIVYCYYIYSKDEHGICNAAHWRETIIKNTPNLYWNKKIHENLLPKDVSQHKIFLDESIVINHLIDDNHGFVSGMRNIKYLLEEYNQDKEKTDPRTLAYLGRMFQGFGEYDKAIFFLEKHIGLSGWDEDRYASWCQLADLYSKKENYEQVIGAAFEALQERPEYPDAYLKLHDIYFNQSKWEKALEWGRQGLLKPIPKNFCLIDPSSYGWRPTLSLAFTLLQLNRFEEALKLFNEAKKDVPNLDFVKDNEHLFKTAVEHSRFMEHYLAVVNFLHDNDQELKIKELLKALPKELEENEVIIKLKQHYSEAKKWSENSVCIFALTSLLDWSPKSVSGGIGGSEEAVICLSKELVKLGLDVTVFNNCGLQAGVYDGVEYKEVLHLNPKDEFNILISWRVNIFENELTAKKKIVWLHDLPYLDLSESRLKNIDKIVVLSQYHKSKLSNNVPEDKVFVSSNGINPEDFNGINEIREPHRIIYASSYNRGLEQLLEMWSDIRKEVPDSSLHIYYGWDVYDAFVKDGQVKDEGFKKKMVKLMLQEGVYEHGRLGHKELLAEYAKAGVFAYPCTYEGEINCIALTKAIASGCKVVTNDFAVMAERSPCSVPNESFKDKLIKLLTGEEQPDLDNYIQENSWETIARDWKEKLFV